MPADEDTKRRAERNAHVAQQLRRIADHLENPNTPRETLERLEAWATRVMPILATGFGSEVERQRAFFFHVLSSAADCIADPNTGVVIAAPKDADYEQAAREVVEEYGRFFAEDAQRIDASPLAAVIREWKHTAPGRVAGRIGKWNALAAAMQSTRIARGRHDVELDAESWKKAYADSIKVSLRAGTP